MFLLDTVAISDFVKTERNAGLMSWISATPDEQQFVSVVSLGEIEAGIHALPTGRRRQALERWAAGLPGLFGDRVLAFDYETSRVWGRTMAQLKARGVTVPAVDVMIAATAIRQGQSVVTRNIRHFEWCGVAVQNPWV